uniref:VWFA domain-containing protein n=1 Tax=viral metagenome TaxID=1070528 RepID=A0A6C0E519_9ZZZZ
MTTLSSSTTSPNCEFQIQHTILESIILDFHTNTNKLSKETLSNMDFASTSRSNTNNESFGCLEIHVGETTINIDPVFFLFNIDESGSMSELCKDGKTKMDHIQFTMNQMLLYFAENPEATIYVHVNAFSDNVRTVIETTQVTTQNVNDIIERIKKIRPQNSTNLELALKTANQTMNDYLQTRSSNNQSSPRMIHVLLTDGHPTMGDSSESSLASLVYDNFSNIFIAFGLDHNPSLMNKLGNAGKNTTNYLVSKLELIGHVYGEIVHNHLFKVLDNVVLDVVDGEGAIYDWYSNEWKTTLHVSPLTNESKRYYYIKSKNPNETTIKISGNPIDSYAGTYFEEYVDKLPDLIETRIIESSDKTPNQTIEPKPTTEDIIVDVDLTKHIFRLCTQRLLYEARQYANTNTYTYTCGDDDNSDCGDCGDYGDSVGGDLTTMLPPLLQRSHAIRSHAFSCYDNNIDNTLFPPPPKLHRNSNINITNANYNIYEKLESLTQSTNLDSLKSRMREHLKIMTEFLEQNNQAHDAQDKQFIKTLCEDMNISLKTIGTTNQQSYINARSTSQGRQQMYNVNINNGPLDPTDPINNVYATPTAMKLMRDFSQR